MNDSLNIEDTAEESMNPLLQIDTNFRTYLNAYTRSFQNHVVGGTLDYAFDSDFAVRQKIAGLGGWGKLSKAVMGNDISAEAKYLFLKCNQAGPLKFPEIYDIAKKCAARLELNLPIIIVRDEEKPLIYSIASEIIEPCVVLTKGLIEMCDNSELQFLIGCECGKIQNNHAVFNMAFTYLNYNKLVYKPVERSYKNAVSNQLVCSLIEWIKYADITADRAGIISLDVPEAYAEIVSSLYEKGYVDFYGRKVEEMDIDQIMDQSKIIIAEPTRSISVDKSISPMQKRILAGIEFISCQSLYNWREDIQKDVAECNSQQVCDIRSNIIIGSGAEV